MRIDALCRLIWTDARVLETGGEALGQLGLDRLRGKRRLHPGRRRRHLDRV